MNDFSITFVPLLDSKGTGQIPNSLSELNISHIYAAYSAEHRIEYRVGGRIFAYYPASILTIVNDIDLELQLIQARENHPMTLTGHTVLYMEFQGDMINLVELIDPMAQDGNGYKKIVGSFEASKIELEFHNSMSIVWGLVQNL